MIHGEKVFVGSVSTLTPSRRTVVDRVVPTEVTERDSLLHEDGREWVDRSRGDFCCFDRESRPYKRSEGTYGR